MEEIKNGDGLLTDDPVEIPNIMASFFKQISSKSSLSSAQLNRYQSLENKNLVTIENKYKDFRSQILY